MTSLGTYPGAQGWALGSFRSETVLHFPAVSIVTPPVEKEQGEKESVAWRVASVTWRGVSVPLASWSVLKLVREASSHHIPIP